MADLASMTVPYRLALPSGWRIESLHGHAGASDDGLPGGFDLDLAIGDLAVGIAAGEHAKPHFMSAGPMTVAGREWALGDVDIPGSSGPQAAARTTFGSRNIDIVAAGVTEADRMAVWRLMWRLTVVETPDDVSGWFDGATAVYRTEALPTLPERLPFTLRLPDGWFVNEGVACDDELPTPACFSIALSNDTTRRVVWIATRSTAESIGMTPPEVLGGRDWVVAEPAAGTIGGGGAFAATDLGTYQIAIATWSAGPDDYADVRLLAANLTVSETPDDPAGWFDRDSAIYR